MVVGTERAILETLVDEGPAHTTDLAASLDAHPLTVTERCERLAAEGYASRIAGGLFEVTDRGRDAVSGPGEAPGSNG